MKRPNWIIEFCCVSHLKITWKCQIVSDDFFLTSKFEVGANIIVITKATNTLHMVIAIPLKNIEEEQKVDRATVEQISKIMRFLRNIED